MKNSAHRWITAAAWVYFSILFGWLALYLTTGDRFGYVSLFNMLASYLFYPMPLVLTAALLVHRREVWAGAALGFAVFLWFWGGQFLPRLGSASTSQTLTVMTYNLLGRHSFTDPQIDTIRAENAEVVMLQELIPTLAAALGSELISEYPYQILDPAEGVTGMGTISKYPIRPSGEELPLNWVGVPQVLILDWNGKEVTVVNFHMLPVSLASSSKVSNINRYREAQAEALADFTWHAGPTIAAGDANATPLSDAYQIITRVLEDSWRQAGFGFGHTFPGSAIQGSSRPRIAGRPVPQWMARIDYVFHSAHWVTLEARLAQFDGVSDHRGVVAVLTWK